MADNIAIFRINYKSDFILTLNSDAGWETPFCIKFWTGVPSQAYFAGYDGTTYTHCAPVEGEPTKLVVQFDDHHLPIGDLKFQIGYHFTVADFPTTVEDEVLNQASVIIEVDDAPAQVMLDFNGETAPEIEFSLPAYANEAQRIANEEERIENEQARISAENERISNEDARIAEEQVRVSQEAARVSEFAQLKEESQAATADANAAATLANEKAALAQQKAIYAQTQGDYAKAQGDYAKAQGDTALADHERAESDHSIAASDHTQAAADHSRAESDHAAVEVYVDSLGAFDISSYHATGGVLAKYADLTAALGPDGANIPEGIRKGGMSVKFVQSSDNKYVQARCMAQNFTTDVTQWQDVDYVPTAEAMGYPHLINIGSQVVKFTLESGKEYLVINNENFQVNVLARTTPTSANIPIKTPMNRLEKYVFTATEDSEYILLGGAQVITKGVSFYELSLYSELYATQDNKSVKYITQSLTDEQKQVARQNIGLGDDTIDDVPTAGSNNLVKSGGVAKDFEITGFPHLIDVGSQVVNFKLINGHRYLVENHENFQVNVYARVSPTSANIPIKVPMYSLESIIYTAEQDSDYVLLGGAQTITNGISFYDVTLYEKLYKTQDNQSVKYIAQTLSDEQKNTARSNINAASQSDLDAIYTAPAEHEVEITKNVGNFVKPNGEVATFVSNFISNRITLHTGDRLTAQNVYASNSICVIAQYDNSDTQYIPLVIGIGNNEWTTNTYTFTAPGDMEVVISASTVQNPIVTIYGQEDSVIKQLQDEVEHTSSPLATKTLYSFGDSLVYGHYDGKGMFDTLADELLSYEKYGQNGAEIMGNNIRFQITHAPVGNPDFVGFDGLTNDAGHSDILEHLGSLSDNYSGTYDTTTFYGSFEQIIYDLLNKYPYAKIFYVAPHNMPTRNAAIQSRLQEIAREVCAKWSIPVVDIYRKGQINTNVQSEQQLWAYRDDTHGLDGGTHLSFDGYKKFYYPLIKAMMLNIINP